MIFLSLSFNQKNILELKIQLAVDNTDSYLWSKGIVFQQKMSSFFNKVNFEA